MEKQRFNFMALLQMDNHENKHKIKPTQFSSIAAGVKNRLEKNIISRKSSRLTVFDNFRNLPKHETTAQAPLNKIEQRLLQLQKWKQDKEKKKKEAILQKKKPFVVGVVRVPLKLESPPKPMPSTSRCMPSTSGRVTRSQSSRTNMKNNAKQIKPDKKQKINIQSFAPKNATFNPVLEHIDKPTLLRIKENDVYIGVDDNLANEDSNSNKNINMIPAQQQPQGRHLRSRTKLSENTKKGKQTQKSNSDNCFNPASSSNSTESFSRNKYPTVNNKPKTKSTQSRTTKTKRILAADSNTTSTSSSTEIHDLILTSPKDSNVKNNPIKKYSKKSTEPTNMSSSKSVASKNESIKHDMDDESSGSKANSLNRIQETKGTPNKSVEDFITFTPKNKVPRSESSSEEKLRSPKSVNLTPQQIVEEARKISPRVCLSRGKDNARKELKERINEGLLDDDVCDMSVEHFRKQLNSEIKRMTEMCETWDRISDQIVLPDNIQEAVLSATGQARLLMSQKLQQFAALLRRCEYPEQGTALVTHLDLQGFWDMVFMQVENVYIKFNKLEEYRVRGWVEEQLPERRSKPRPKPPARSARPAAASRLRDIIAAARRAKKEQVQSDIEKGECHKSEIKTFEAGFFSVQSPVKSLGVPGTPMNKSSLLKAVLSSEAKKMSAKRSSYAMLRASTIGKSVENEDEAEHVGPSTPVNLTLTPGRSILKTNNNISTKKSKTVLFNSSDNDSNGDTSNESYKREDISGVEALINTSVEEPEVADEKENRRYSRRLNLQRQDAMEVNTPIKTRSKTIRTPNSDKVRKSRRSSRMETLPKINLEEETSEAPNVCSRSKRRTVQND